MSLHTDIYTTFFPKRPKCEFGWTMNNDSVPDTTDNEYEDYYPGDAYVDYIGIDGFNFASMADMGRSFGPAYY